jgi:hypothetical protein
VEIIFDEVVQSDVERFQEKIGLRPGADIQMILLKAHLLIEEGLQSFIDGAVRDATLLTKARFTFAQRLILAEALHSDPNCFRYGWVWEATRDLNALRNQMAHNLEPKDFSNRLASLTKSIEARLPVPIKPGEGTEYEMARFGLAVSILNLCLTRLLHSKYYVFRR